MNMRNLLSKSIGAAVVLSAVLWQPAPGFALSMVTASSIGDGVFQIAGTNIEGAAAIELAVSYDSASLANPRVVEGPLISGAMTAFNPNVPGIARMAIIRLTPVKGSGVIGTLTFDRKGPSAGKILSVVAKLADSNGNTLPVQVQINNPSDTATTNPVDPQDSMTAAGAGETPAAGSMGILVGPKSESAADAEGNPGPKETAKTEGQTDTPESLTPQQDDPTLTTSTDERSGVGVDRADGQAQSGITFMQKSVLDRFKEYRGKRTPAAFVSLFDQDRMYWWYQQPQVALADGKTTVRVTFITTPGNKTQSEIAVLGASLVSMKKDPDNSNTWIVELLPKKGEYQASIAVAQGGINMIYPLTIAPQVAIRHAHAGTITQKEFSRAVARQSIARLGLDANRDSKIDYIDDYIITANYLASAKTKHNIIGSRTSRVAATYADKNNYPR